MRGNTTVVIELPCDLHEFTTQLSTIVNNVKAPSIWNARFIEADQRDGSPRQLSLTIGWESLEDDK